MKLNLFIGLVLSIWVSRAFSADEVKQTWDEVKTLMNTHESTLKEYCGKPITVSFDKNSYGKGSDELHTAQFCEEVVKAVYMLCKEPQYKPKVQNAIKTIFCKYDASLKFETDHGQKLELKDGKLTHAYNSNSANLFEFARNEWLPKKLDSL